jgi:hypothetical protein
VTQLQPNFSEIREWFHAQGFIGKTEHRRHEKIKHITTYYTTKLDRKWMRALYVGGKRVGWYARWYAEWLHYSRVSQLISMKHGKRYGSLLNLLNGSLSVITWTDYLFEDKKIRLCREDLSIRNEWRTHDMLIMLKLPIDTDVLIRFLDFMRSNEFETWYLDTHAVGKMNDDVERAVEMKLLELSEN